jgi:hypothetical protein
VDRFVFCFDREALVQVQRQHLHVANQRADVLHKLSNQLVKETAMRRTGSRAALAAVERHVIL